ncbi:MAG TPA: hypothetical protein VF348_06855 [Usitatibacter sp.]
MLREIPETRQIRGEPRRRWFNSEWMDLYVWYDTAGAPLGFQLCYGKPLDEKALTWFRPDDFSHMAVDHGGPAGRGKETPLLVLDGLFLPGPVSTEFVREAAELPEDVAQLVLAMLRAYPGPDS